MPTVRSLFRKYFEKLKFVLVQHVSSKVHFRHGRPKILLVNLWQPMTAWNPTVRTQAWKAKWAVFQNPGVCLQAFPPFPSPLFYALHFSRGNSLLPNPTETLATQANRRIETIFWNSRLVCFSQYQHSTTSNLKKHQRQSNFTKWNKEDIRKILRDPYVDKLKSSLGNICQWSSRTINDYIH